MEQNALSEALKGMSAISVAFKNFYPVVETFTGSIGFAIFPSTLNICTVMTDGVGTPLGPLTGRG